MTSPTSADQACPACAARVLPDDRFCPGCGIALKNGTIASAAAIASPWDAVLRRLQAATLGQFEVKRELGRGGMAAVYLAHDIALDLKVAIKVMAPGIMMGEGMIERFRLEAVTVAKLSHPHIVRVHALRQAAEDLHFIVMQYIPGRTLERIVRETGPLPIPVVRTMLGQVARALAYAHKRGVVHRDVKPGNIMLDASGDAVVTDFGIAKVATAPSHTLTGSVVGTPAYMSPEQCFARPLTGASDQYSLGVVAFEMLTGQVPYTGASYTVMHGHTHGEIPSIRALRPDCPPDLEATVTRMLAKAPEDRFASIGDAAAAAGATTLGEHDPIRDELVRLAAVEESVVLDALHPTPLSPIPQTRASMPRVSQVEPAPPPAPTPVASKPIRVTPARVTPAASVPSERTIVDPALLTPPPPKPPQRAPTPQAPGTIRVIPRRTLMWGAGGILAVAVTAILLTQPWTDTGSPARNPPTTPPDSVTQPPLPGKTLPGGEPAAASVRIADVPLTIAVGDTFTLGAIVTGDDSLGRAPNEWRSAPPAVIRINAGGRAVALREGIATVSLRRGALADSVTLRVLPGSVSAPTTRLVIATPASPIRVADRVRLRTEEIDARGTRRPTSGRVTWSSADPTIASVDATTGDLVAHSAGRAVVSARTAAGRTMLVITVEAPPAQPPAPDPVQPKQDSVIATPPPPPVEPPRERPPPTKSQAELRSELDDVLRSYARAIAAEDVARLRAVYPAISSAQIEGFRAFFAAARDIQLSIERIDAPAQLSATPGSEARVRVQYRIEYFNTSLSRSARESERWDATLERTATAWRIVAIR